MKGRGESTVDAARCAESFPEFRDEDGPTIRAYGLGEAVKFEHVFDIKLCEVFGGCCIAAGD